MVKNGVPVLGDEMKKVLLVVGLGLVGLWVAGILLANFTNIDPNKILDGVSSFKFAMDRLTLFGLVAVSLMLFCYAFEERSRWFTLGFAGACWLGSAYGFLQGAWPFGMVEGIWGFVAFRKFWVTAK
jgi:hypothetical protein